MSILIPGMEMPPHCFNCSTKVDPDNRRCNIDGHVFEETLGKLTCRRDDACPLCSVPPHGRLIDADALFEEVYKVWGTEYDASECNSLMGFINDAPTIIPADPCKEKGE